MFIQKLRVSFLLGAALLLLLLLLHPLPLHGYTGDGDGTCHPTSAEDVLVAAHHANYVGHSGVKVGDAVEGAKEYRVLQVII